MRRNGYVDHRVNEIEVEVEVEVEAFILTAKSNLRTFEFNLINYSGIWVCKKRYINSLIYFLYADPASSFFTDLIIFIPWKRSST